MCCTRQPSAALSCTQPHLYVLQLRLVRVQQRQRVVQLVQAVEHKDAAVSCTEPTAAVLDAQQQRLQNAADDLQRGRREMKKGLYLIR